MPDEVRGEYQIIVLAVKAQATQAALAMLEPHLAPDGYVLSAQNGLNELTIARAVGDERCMGCFVNFGADWLGPGEILFGNRGAVVVGEIDGSIRERTRQMHRHLLLFEPNAVLTDNIWGYLWGKLAYGAMLFATALTEDSMSENFADPRRFVVFDRLAREVMAVASARADRARRIQRFRSRLFRARCRRCRSARLDCSAGRVQSPHRQDALGHLSRPRRAQAQDRSRSADRDDRGAGARGGRSRRPPSLVSSSSFTTSRRDAGSMSFATFQVLIDACEARRQSA